MLSDEEIDAIGSERSPYTDFQFARAIESAATAPLLARIAEQDALIGNLRLEAQIQAQEARTANASIAEIYQAVTGGTGEPGNWHGAAPVKARIAELTRELEEARKDAADADSMCEAMKKVIDQNDARWKFLHTTNKDSEGFEWCVLRVKWENGRISEALHTYSNMADLDAAIKEQS